MRIAHVLMGRCNPESPNGVDKAVYHLSRHQAAAGDDVAVFSITDKPPVPIPGVAVKAFPPRRAPVPLPAGRAADLLWMRSPLNLPPALTPALLAWRPDVVHFHFVHIPQFIRIAARLRRAGIPYCVSLHGGLAGEALARRRIAKRAFSFLVERRYLNRAAFIHAVSSADVAGGRAYGMDNRVVVAPNGIDEAAGASVAQATGRGAGPRLFLFLGRLDPEQKGLDLLLRAWAEVDPPCTLLLVGPDWRGGGTRLRSLDPPGSVLFHDAVAGEEKWRMLAEADVFVHPSRWEAGVPLSVLEAMSVSRPVLITTPADPDGLVSDAGAGVVSAPTLESLAGAIASVAAASDDDLVDMGRSGRALVEDRFRWASTVHRLGHAYRRADEAARSRRQRVGGPAARDRSSHAA
jgi:glycosyltransferase involved in cell wall biosynthesis